MVNQVKIDTTVDGDTPTDYVYVSSVTIKGRRIFCKAMFTATAGLTT